MDKRVKALVIERTLVESDIVATELMLTKITMDQSLVPLAWDYLDLLDMVRVKVVNEYNKALGEL